MDEFKIKILQEEADRLNKALRELDDINFINNSLIKRKENQKKLNKAYDFITNAKMNLEKFIEKMEV